MKKFYIGLIFCLLLFLIYSHAFSDETTLAVLDFENNSLLDPEEYISLSKGLAEIMITEMNQVKAIRIVERQKLRSLLDELKLSQSGIISNESTVQVGKMLGAQHLVFGGYMVTLDKKIRIDVRIVEVETGLTIKAVEVTGKTKDVLSLIKRLSKKILTDLDVRLTKGEEEFFNKSENFDMDAVLFFSKGLEFEELGQLEEAGRCFKKALQIEPHFQQAGIRLQKLSEAGK